jgi:hypothetical protein
MLMLTPPGMLRGALLRAKKVTFVDSEIGNE